MGICVDCETWTIYVLDCNTALRSDREIVKELTPLAESFLYMLIQAGGATNKGDVIPMVSERAKGVAQNSQVGDSAINAVVLMWNHSLGGLEACRAANAGHISQSCSCNGIWIPLEVVGFASRPVYVYFITSNFVFVSSCCVFFCCSVLTLSRNPTLRFNMWCCVLTMLHPKLYVFRYMNMPYDLHFQDVILEMLTNMHFSSKYEFASNC